MSMKDELEQGGHTVKLFEPDFHEHVLKIIEQLVDLDPPIGSKHGDLLAVLSDAIVEYDAKYYPIGAEEEARAKLMGPLGRKPEPKPLLPSPVAIRHSLNTAWPIKCKCGHPELENIVHRVNGACYSLS